MNRHIALSIEDITQFDARHVLYFRDKEHGFQPGSYLQALLQAAWLADDSSLETLAKAYPGLIAAFYISKQDAGIEILQSIALGQDNVVAAAEAIVRGEM